MPVPSKMQDLATLAASNSPSGSDPIGNTLDDYIRAAYAILRSTNALATAVMPVASTVDLGAADAVSVTISGSGTITSFGTSTPGLLREVVFAGTVTVTASASIVIPSGDYTAAAGDIVYFRSWGAGVWKMVTSPNFGFRPVQQGGGTGQLSNKLYLGAAAGSKIKIQVDATDYGNVAMEAWANANLVKQGGGAGQTTNQINIGWSSGSKLKAQVDSSDLGAIALESWVGANYAPISSPTFAGGIQSNMGTLGSALFSDLLGWRVYANDGNTDAIRCFLFRNTAGGTGFGSAAWRMQRIVDTTSMGFLQFGDGIDPSGDANRVTLGNNLGGTLSLNGSGNCVASGTVSATDFIYTSDRRLKDGIKQLRQGLDTLKKMLPRRYVKYDNEQFEGQGKPEFGFIHDEVKAAAPEAASDGEGGYGGVSAMGVLAIVANTVLELDARMAKAGI